MVIVPTEDVLFVEVLEPVVTVLVAVLVAMLVEVAIDVLVETMLVVDTLVTVVALLEEETK